MSDIVLEFDHVWKKFRKGERYDSLRDLIPAATKRLFNGRRRDVSELEEKEFWAIKDISFQVERGEALGVVGRNGAGKSTTLKLLSKILRPNKGQINVRGRLSALIEVGAGFHPDLTGRENIFLNGTILGMRRGEIKKKLDEIIEFSEISEFIDTPVKRYSSGMYARLGFSIAVHVDPEILVVDEVLSVGDMWFQEKCLNKMLSIKNKGITIIFVSHNLESVNILCSKTAFIKNGQLMEIGPTPEVIKNYVCSSKDGSDIPEGNNQIWAIKLLDETGDTEVNTLSPGQRVNLFFTLKCDMPYDECNFGFIVTRLSDGASVCDYSIPLKSLSNPNAGTTAIGNGVISEGVISFEANLLRGAYSVSLYINHFPSSTQLVHVGNAVVFAVEERISWNGVAHLNPSLHPAEHGKKINVDLFI